MKELTNEELEVILDEMSMRAREFIGIHVKDRLRKMIEPLQAQIFNEKEPVADLTIRWNMIFHTADLRDILKDKRAGRISSLPIPQDVDAPPEAVNEDFIWDQLGYQ